MELGSRSDVLIPRRELALGFRPNGALPRLGGGFLGGIVDRHRAETVTAF
jgi:hypothetical protein